MHATIPQRMLLTALLLAVATLQVREVRRLIAERTVSAELVGAPAPDLSARDSRGGSLQLVAHRGRFLVVSFWASWCAPCRVEMPELIRFVDEWNQQQLEVQRQLVYVAVNVGEPPDAVVSVLEDPRYKDVLFGFDRDGTTSKSWGVKGLPATFLVSPEGLVLEAVQGYEDKVGVRLRSKLRSYSAGSRRS